MMMMMMMMMMMICKNLSEEINNISLQDNASKSLLLPFNLTQASLMYYKK